MFASLQIYFSFKWLPEDFQRLSQLQKCFQDLQDLQDFFAHCPRPLLSVNLELCVFVGHHLGYLP